MACEYICDGCGKREPVSVWLSQPGRGFQKPAGWFERADKDGIQVACSRPCIELIAQKSGKTAVVALF